MTVSGFPVNNEALITPALTLGNIETYDAVVAKLELMALLDVTAKLAVVVKEDEIDALANDALVATNDADDQEADTAEVATPVGAHEALIADDALTELFDHDAVPNNEPDAVNTNILAVFTYNMLSNAIILYSFHSPHYHSS